MRALLNTRENKVSSMELVKTTKTHKIFKRKDGRFAVKTRKGAAVIGVDKIALLAAEGLITAPEPKAAPEPEPEVVEEAAAEEVVEEVAAEEAPAEEAAAEEPAAEEVAQEVAEEPAAEAPVEEAAAEEAPAEEAEEPKA